MNLVCTGDADDKVFNKILTKQDIYNRKGQKFERKWAWNPASITTLMIPHHGSKDNKSAVMLQLFKPDILAISAGNGRQYGHPNKEAVDFYEAMSNQNQAQPAFFKNFQPCKIDNLFLHFSSKKEADTDNPYCYIGNTINNIPIICTNILGTIKVDKDGFKSQFFGKNNDLALQTMNNSTLPTDLNDENSLKVFRFISNNKKMIKVNLLLGQKSYPQLG